MGQRGRRSQGNGRTGAGKGTRNLTVDGGLGWKRLSLQSAVYHRGNRAGAVARAAFGDWGMYAQGGIYVIARRLELAGRVSRVDFEGRLTPRVSDRATESSVGINYYIHGHHLRIQGDYSLVRQSPFRGGFRENHRVRAEGQIFF